jgi:hypothetical protein
MISGREKPKWLEENQPQCHTVHHKSKCALGLCGEKLVTNQITSFGETKHNYVRSEALMAVSTVINITIS